MWMSKSVKKVNKMASEGSFTWTDKEIELLLETVKAYKVENELQGKDWESIRTKYETITGNFQDSYPKNSDEDYPRSGNRLSKLSRQRVTSKLKNIRSSYKKAVDAGRRSGGGRVVMTFFDLCTDIWSGSPSTTICNSSNSGKFYCGIIRA